MDKKSKFTSWLNIAVVYTLSMMLISCGSNVKSVNNDTPVRIADQGIKSEVLSESIVKPEPVKIIKEEPHGMITSEINTVNNTDSRTTVNLKFKITFPSASSKSSLRTKATDISAIQQIKVYIKGLGITSTIYADGSDANQMLSAPGGFVNNVTISAVPSGKSRIATVIAYDTNGAAIPAYTLKTAFDIPADGSNVNVEISPNTTPAGIVVESLINDANSFNQVLGYHLDLTALQNFIDTVTGKTGTYPNYIYNNTHPSLVNTAFIITFITNNNGIPLSGDAPDYKLVPGSISCNISGLVNTDTVNVKCDDPASSITTNAANGTLTISNVTPGTWTVTVTPSFGDVITYSPVTLSNVAVSIGVSVDENIELIPATPTVTGFTDLGNTAITGAKIGDSIKINGTNFYPDKDYNMVRFGTTTAAITSATSNQLIITVPQTSDNNVTVQVGSQSGVSLDVFHILPLINITAPAAGLVNGTVNLTADVTSGNPVSSVEFFGTLNGIDTKLGDGANTGGSLYSYNWDTSVVLSGSCNLTAKITDSATNMTTSLPVNISIDQPPVITGLTADPPSLTGIGVPTELICNATDKETIPTSLCYTWTCADGGTFSPSNTGVHVIWLSPAAGTYTIKVSVSDGINPPVEQTIPVIVSTNSSNVTLSGGQ